MAVNFDFKTYNVDVSLGYFIYERKYLGRRNAKFGRY
jgi:hypothetical protein